jgi:hypothetical protein
MFAPLSDRNFANKLHWEATVRSISLIIAVYFSSTTSVAIVRDSSLVEIVSFHSIVFGILAAFIFHRHE